MIIKNANIVLESEVFNGDIKIKDEIIAEISENINAEKNEEIIDAKDLFLIPGGVDAHTHLDLDVGIATAVDDFYTGTVAAAFGGTTSIVDHMAFGPKGCSLSHQVDVYHGLAKDKAVLDYGFHGVIQHVDENILNEMQTLIDEGITSYKFYLTYDYKLNDKDAFVVLERAKELGLIITVHPENDGVVNYLRNKYKEEGLTTPWYHGQSRPLECEAEAIGRMILFAKMANEPYLYIVHLSNGLGLDFIRQAIERGQKNLFVETCPQYLVLDESKYKSNDEGLKYIMSPPLRAKENNEMLWKGIEKGFVDVIATDHCPFNYNKEKQMGKDDFTKCPNGAPSIELRIPILFSEGVSKKRIGINDFVNICSTNPAKIFGLYPKKGVIKVGSDADLVLIDPNKKVKVTKSMLHENVDYTPYEGMELLGYPVMTVSRGEIIVKDGEFLGQKGRGKYIKRELYKN